ncbi:MAG: GNAT family N-acetyltransferase [Chloroflexota bacterium]
MIYDPKQFDFRPMDRETAIKVASWRYEPPYDIYNALDLEGTLECYLDPDYHYYSVWHKNELIAFRCFGPDAQVPGGDYSADALDMGGGLRPDLTGKGLGAGLMKAAFEFARKKFNPPAFRATVAGFNVRAQKVCLRVGYQEAKRFFSQRLNREFVIFYCINLTNRDTV